MPPHTRTFFLKRFDAIRAVAHPYNDLNRTSTRAMPSALPSCDLKSFKGTAQEIAEARQIVASHSKAKKRSVEESIRQYVIKNPQNCNMDDADRKADMIMNFTMLAERNKKNSKKFATSHGVNITASKKVEWHFWNPYQMDKEMGPDVGELWRKPNTLKRFPCPLTNKTEDLCSVWRVP